MKEQKSENEKDKNDKKTLEANCACTLRTCTLETCGEKIKRETCVNTPAKAELLAREVEINPTKLSELINKEINNSIKELNNSIKDAVQTIVKQCSMEEKRPVFLGSKDPRVCRSSVVEEHRKKSPDVYTNLQTTGHALRQYNDLSSHSNSYICSKMYENNAILLPAKNKVNNENKSKKHTKSANVNTDNRRITGNVNIYICSETNDNDQEKGKKKSMLQYYTNASSDTITEQSRCASASSASSCRLINSIREKRKKLQMQQSPNFNHDKMDKSSDSSDDNAVYDNRTQRRSHRKESSESKEKQVDVKVSDKNVECKDTISSTRDNCCCKDTSISSINLRHDSSDSTTRVSLTNVYPLETRVNDSFLSNTICTNVERKDHRKNDDRSNICGNGSEYSVCHAIDGSKWLPKSIYTDCATYGKISKECFTDNCKYRNKRLQDSVLNRNNIRKRQLGYKILQQLPASCQREHVTRQWSTYSCIAEEEEDRYMNVNKVEEKFPENVCNNAKCPEKASICRTFPGELIENTTVCETSFNIAGEHFEKTYNGTFGDSMECPKDTIVCGATFGNSKELPKVTRVCKEFVTEEPPEDITVCRTMFGEPKGLPEEVTICETALSDSKEAPKKTICKIPDSNFANQDDVKRVFLNNAKDKFTKENTNSLNLSNQKENAERITQLENKYSVVLNNFTRQKSVENIKHDEQKEIISNDQSEIPTASLGSIKDSKPSSKSIYSATLLCAQSYNHPIHVSKETKETPKTLVNQQKTIKSQLSSNRSMRNFQQPDKVSTIFTTRNLVSNENNQPEDKMQKESKQENQNSLKEIEMIEEKPRESFLHRSLKKMIDTIRSKAQSKDRIETEKTESVKTADDRKNVGKSEITVETKDRIRDQQKSNKRMATLMRSPLVKREITRKILRVARTKPTPPITGFKIREEKMIGISKIDRTMPKLLRIIAAKRLHLPSAVIAIDSKSQVPEVESIPEIITNGYVDRKEVPEKEVIPQESISAEIAEEIKAKDSVASKTNVIKIETSVKDIPDIANIPKDILDENRIPEHVANETSKIHVTCPSKKSEEKLKRSISCKSSDPNGCSCLNNKYNNTFKDCFFKDNVLEQKEDFCAHCLLLTAQCICALQCLKDCSKNEKSKFHISPSRITQHICTYCYRIREECKYRKTATVCYQPHENCKYRCCATRSKHSRMIDKCRCRSPASCINCYRPRDRCCCATFALIKRHKTKKGCNLKRAMICLYCDNPQHRCTCRVPIGKCSYCKLPSDVCNCRNDRNRDRERIAEEPDENRTIQVTSWKPKREIRQYFGRNLEDFRSYSIEECRCYEKPKQYPEELPYQRLNIFSDVMNELQQKMSEAVSCAQCWKNPCCCESQVNQDEDERGGKANCYVRYLEIEKLLRNKLSKSKPRNKSPNCWCNSTLKNERENVIQKSMSTRYVCFVCKSSPCRCGKGRSSYKRPLAKCYYCKSLPCT